MKNIYAIKKDTKVCRGNITSTGMYDTEIEDRYYDDILYDVLHESGAPQMKLIDGKLVMRTEQEIQLEPKYKAWWNAKIEAQLEKLDIKRIRPSAEINDDDTSAQDKTAAKASLKTLNVQAATLRSQLLK